MGEEVAGLPEAAAVGAAGGLPSEPIGAYLARQRRLRGVALDELARSTCIPLRSLERLESGAFDGAPDGFARGFVRTVASALGLDPEETVSRMLPEVQPGARRRVRGQPEPERSWAGLALGVLLLALAGVWLAGRGADRPGAELLGQHVYRRDAVRELARQQGALPDAALAPAPSAPSAP